MHILRVKRAEKDLSGVTEVESRKSLLQSSGDDRSNGSSVFSDRSLQLHHLISDDDALCNVTEDFTVTHLDGAHSSVSGGFLRRLVPSTPIPPSTSGGNGEHAISNLASSVRHVAHSLRMLRGAPSASSLKMSLSSVHKSTTTAASSDFDGEADEGSDGASSGSSAETFFRRMQREYQALQRLNPASLRLAEEDALQLQSLDEDYVTRVKNSAGTLHPLIRTEPSKREMTERLFSELQQPIVRDAVRSDAIQRLEQQQRRYHKQIDAIVDPACALLEAVWEKHVVPQAARKRFADKYFTSPSIESFTAIHAELQRFQHVPTTEKDLIRYVGLRETYVAHLKQLLANPALLDDRTEAFVAEGIVADIFSTILLIRHVTCEIIDCVENRRWLNLCPPEALSGNTRPSSSAAPSSPAPTQLSSASNPDTPVGLPLLFGGTNYVIRMQSDLDFVATSKLAPLLAGTYALTSNPLLLPSAVQQTRDTMMHDLKHHKTSLRDTLTNSRERVVEEQYWKEQREKLSNTSTVDDLVPSALNVSASLSNNSNKKLLKPPAPLRSGSTTSVVCIPEGVDVCPPSRSSLTSTPALQAVNHQEGGRRSATPTPHQVSFGFSLTPKMAPMSTTIDTSQHLLSLSSSKPPSRLGTPIPTSLIISEARPSDPLIVETPPCVALPADNSHREAFFRKKKKEELMRTRRIPMNRSNVYQYPASVYKEKPVPIWTFLGRVLQRSLDPRVEAETYVDKLDFERMQYGTVSIPPAFFGKQTDPVINLETQVFRSVLTEIPVRTYAALVQRDVVLFTEDAFIERAMRNSRFHRVIDRLKLTYRGFVRTLHRYQAIRDPKRNVVREYLEWVSRYAPSWSRDAKAALELDNDDDDALGELMHSS